MSRRHIVIPAAIVVALGVFAACLSVVTDSPESRAEDALRAIVAAEHRFRGTSGRAYTRLDELIKTRHLSPRFAPGYELSVEVTNDGKAFWARAVAVRPGLKSLIMDSKGAVVLLD